MMDQTQGAARARGGSQAASLAGLAACVLAGTLFLAATGVHGPPCLSHTLLHVACPACGFTRSLVEVWRGNLVASLRFHPLGLPLFVLCAALLAGWLIAPLRPHVDRVTTVLLGAASLRLILAALIGVYAIRMLLAAVGSRFFVW